MRTSKMHKNAQMQNYQPQKGIIVFKDEHAKEVSILKNVRGCKFYQNIHPLDYFLSQVVSQK